METAPQDTTCCCQNLTQLDEFCRRFEYMAGVVQFLVMKNTLSLCHGPAYTKERKILLN